VLTTAERAVEMSDGEAAASADRDGEDDDDERTGSMNKKTSKHSRVTADAARSTADVVAASEEGNDEEKTAKVFRRLLAISFAWPMSME
jgi:hypothetical protein